MHNNNVWITQCEFKLQNAHGEEEQYKASAAVWASSRTDCYDE
jgi:hypothetical protein